jgi:hypothetical protein
MKAAVLLTSAGHRHRPDAGERDSSRAAVMFAGGHGERLTPAQLGYAVASVCVARVRIGDDGGPGVDVRAKQPTFVNSEALHSPAISATFPPFHAIERQYLRCVLLSSPV